MPHLRRTFLVPPDLEDLLVADLWEAGTLGVHSAPAPDGRVRVEAYFPPDAPAWRGAEPAGEDLLPDTDWLAVWRERVQPFPVGRTLVLDPREPGGAPATPATPADVPPGRRLLLLPARAAFGTGSHESTSLALELLEDLDLAGRRVLDVGTGTGVLAFAALAGGARLAVAYDLDPAAPFHARDNSRLNRLFPRLFVGTSAALAERPLFDLALVNVVPEEILPELPGLARRLLPGGGMILSGILVERGRQVLDRAASLGLAERTRREAGGWIAFHLELAPRAPVNP